MYQVETTPQFDEDVLNLDPRVARRIIKKLEWLAANAQTITHEELKGMPSDLQGLCRYRVGDYRILYWIYHERQLIRAYGVGHRRQVYTQLNR